MDTYFSKLQQEGVPDTLPPGPMDFAEMFDEFVASTPKVWAHDRTKSVGASEAFGCIRKTWFTKRGVEFGFEKDPSYKERWGATRRGDMIENHHVVPAMEQGIRRRGGDLILAGDGQDTIVSGNSSATLDGLVIGATKNALAKYGVKDLGTDCFVLEMKSFDPMMNLSEEKGIHRGQAMMQMGLIRETTEWKPNHAVILYVQASWLDDIRPFVVDWDEDVYNIGRRRNDRVFDENNPAMLQPEGKVIGLCDYCDFKNSCTAVNAGRVPTKTTSLKKAEVIDQSQWLIDKLDDRVMEVAAMVKEQKKLKEGVEKLRESIKQDLILSNKSRAVGKNWKVSYTLVAGRSVLSKDKMVEDGLDPDDYMDSANGFEKLTISTS